MNSIDIITKHLKDNGYDGLFCPGECSCEVDDLVPCGNDFSMCEPGYFISKDSENFSDEFDFMIGPDKP